MSDQSQDQRDQDGRTRMTVPEAARVLRITEGAVRKRVERGKLDHERTPDGRLLVYLDVTTTNRDRVYDKTYDTTTERYVSSLEGQVEYLRQQLDQERDANRENRRIIAALTSRIPELEAPSEQQEAADHTSVWQASVEEAGKEAGRRFVGLIVSGFTVAPSAVVAVVSYFNDATALAVASAVVAIVGTLGGAYFGIKIGTGGDAARRAEEAQRRAREAMEDAK